MADEVLTVKDAVYRLQLSLLEGIKDENLLFAAGSLMSQSDYQDVVTERNIANMCGYPLCINSLPSERPWKGHYRISLKEHKVYDLHETYKYCSSSCLINSRAFSRVLQEERSSTLNPAKLNKVLNMFEGLSLNSKVNMGKKGDLGLSELKIQEKTDKKAEEVSMEEWIGPSNAIEGYVPRRDNNLKPQQTESLKKESKPRQAKPNEVDIIFDDMNFSSSIITQEYSISKLPGSTKAVPQMKSEEQAAATGRAISEAEVYKSDNNKSRNDHLNASEVYPDSSQNNPSTKVIKEETGYNHGISSTSNSTRLKSSLKTSDAKKATRSITWADENDQVDGKNLCEFRELDQKKEDGVVMDFSSSIIAQEYSISKLPSPTKADLQVKGEERAAATEIAISEAEVYKSDSNKSGNDQLNVSEVSPHSSQNNRSAKVIKEETDYNHGMASTSNSTGLKSSLKTSDAKKATCSVTWADENAQGDGKNLCEFRELDQKKEDGVASNSIDMEVDGESYRLSSAEACAKALTQAAEAVASGKSDAFDAVSESGVIILPPPHEADEAESQENGDVMDTNPSVLKWPSKPGLPNYDFFDSEDSWYDNPPEGFSLTLSPFATMFMALFAWISSSSLAYIYGRNETYHEEYISINGREYPRKIVMEDGRSAEIKQTLAGCLARSLPGLVAELRLPTPISTLEQGLARLLDTMSFVDPLPSFRMKQWQVIILLFLDALSVSRIPSLTQYMTGRRVLLPKVLEGAQISTEEYEIMKDLIIPLGRVPQFSTQSGG